MKGDLVVLAADRDIEFALRGILNRTEALGIRSLEKVEFLPYPQRDPGVFNTGAEILRPYAREYQRALVVLDRAWAGAPRDTNEVERAIEQRLRPVWESRARALCIDPEVEVWVWSDSPHVATELGWGSTEELRSWLRSREFWSGQSPKPANPKTAFRAALQERRIPLSPAIFRNLAERVGFARCKDASFLRLLGILRTWFSRAAAENERANLRTP